MLTFHESLAVAFGIVLIVEGVPWFLSPERSKRMLRELCRVGDATLRWLGLALMLAGLLLVYLARG